MSSVQISHNRAGYGLAGAALLAAFALGVPAYTSHQQRVQVAHTLTGGNADQAPRILRRYGCVGCHTIPGIAGADGQVGGRLSDLRKRVYIGGVVTNTSENLVRWIVSPQTFSPRSAMPATGISESEARDVAAYLYGQ